jgi:hypothetical protein
LTPTWKVEAGKPVFITFMVRYDDGTGATVVELRKNNAQAVTVSSNNNERYYPAFVRFGGREYGNVHQDYFHGTFAHAMYATNGMLAPMNDALWSATSNQTTLTESSTVGQVLDFADCILYRRLDPGLSTVLPPQWNNDTDVSGLLADSAGDGDGTFFVGPGGEATLHNRSRRWVTASRFTVSEFSDGMRFVLDAQNVYNRVTAQQTTGTERTVSDDASIAQYGLRATEVRRNVASVNDLSDAAGWILHRYRESSPRVESFTVDASALNGSNDADLIGLAHGGTLSDKVTLAGLPASAPTDTMSFFIEGLSKSIEVDGAKLNYKATFNISDAARSSAFVLEDSVFGVLDSDVAVLAY